jgi:hypothetical protein
MTNRLFVESLLEHRMCLRLARAGERQRVTYGGKPSGIDWDAEIKKTNDELLELWPEMKVDD